MSKIRRRISAVIVILVLAATVVLYLQYRKAHVAQPKVETATVARGTITQTVSATGTLQPLTTVEVKSNVGGTVIYLGVDEGDLVKAGQVIARIDPADSQTALEQVEADLAGSRSRINQTQQNLRLLHQQNIAQVRSGEQAVATARLRLAQAEKQATLQTTVTVTNIEQAQQGLESARARLAQAEEQAKLQPQLTDAAIAQAKSNLDAARTSYQQTKTALASQKIAAAQASFDQAQANVEYAVKDQARQKGLQEKGFVARSIVEAAEQRYRVAKAGLDSAKQKLETVKTEAQQDIDQAQARMEQAEAALKSTQANRAQDSLKQQDVQAARASVKQAEAALKSAQANGAQDSLKRDDVAAARAALEQAKSALVVTKANALQEKMKDSDIIQAQAQVKHSEASVTNARTQLAYTTITAPRDGVVIKKYAEVGSIVTAGRSSIGGSGSGVTIVDIADVSRMTALVNVDETDIAQIKLSQQVDITMDAYADAKFAGRVTKISPQTVVDQNVTTVPVTVELTKADTRLKPGMNATCDFIIAQRENVLTVPLAAVKEMDGAVQGGPADRPSGSGQRTGGPPPGSGRRPAGARGSGHKPPNKMVTVVSNGVQESRPVEVGLTDDNNAEIIRGLNEGEKVVTSDGTTAKKTDTQSQRRPMRGPGPF